MQPFYLYILKCSNDSYYIGHTDNIERRLEQHQSTTENSYVSRYLPAKLVFIECLGTRAEAFEAERRIKKWTRKKKEALIRRDFEFLSALAKKNF